MPELKLHDTLKFLFCFILNIIDSHEQDTIISNTNLELGSLFALMIGKNKSTQNFEEENRMLHSYSV